MMLRDDQFPVTTCNKCTPSRARTALILEADRLAGRVTHR
jgi:hypothetical protein